MERKITNELSYLDRCKMICMEDLPTDIAGQIAVCVSLINELKQKRDDVQVLLERQRADLIQLLRDIKKLPKSFDYCVYTEKPELYGDLVGAMPDGIIFTSTHGHTANYLDTASLKKNWPGFYVRYLKPRRFGGKVLTGKEIMGIVYNQING